MELFVPFRVVCYFGDFIFSFSIMFSCLLNIFFCNPYLFFMMFSCLLNIYIYIFFFGYKEGYNIDDDYYIP